MKIADLVKKKKQRVLVRVPTKLRDKLGDETTGTVMGLVRAGKHSMLVSVRVPRRGTYKFRPQDLSVA